MLLASENVMSSVVFSLIAVSLTFFPHSLVLSRLKDTGRCLNQFYKITNDILGSLVAVVFN